MKTGKTVFYGILAIIFILTFVNCDNGGGSRTGPDLGPGTRDAVTYTGTSDGVTYTLKIEDGSGRAVLTPRANDKYTLTAGGKTSTGIVVSFINSILDLKPSNAEITFTATISGSGLITTLTGTLTWTDNTTAEAPTALTPGNPSDGKVYFRVGRFDNGPEINSNTRVDLLLKDYFSGTLENGKYYTVTISGNLDKAINQLTLMFYLWQDWLWDDNNVGSWDSWETIHASIPAGKFTQSFKILIRDDITIKPGQDIIVHFAYGGRADFDKLENDTITATISNFKMTINEWTDDETDEGGEGTDPGNGGGYNPPGGGTNPGNGDENVAVPPPTNQG